MATLKTYPQAAPDGSAIPYDIGYPYGLYIIAVAVSASAAKALPEDAEIAVAYATCDTVFTTDGSVPSVAADTFHENSNFVPTDGSLSVKLTGTSVRTISADGSSTGKLYLLLYRPWEGVVPDVLTRKQ